MTFFNNARAQKIDSYEGSLTEFEQLVLGVGDTFVKGEQSEGEQSGEEGSGGVLPLGSFSTRFSLLQLRRRPAVYLACCDSQT